jgi:hypothetical protein
LNISGISRGTHIRIILNHRTIPSRNNKLIVRTFRMIRKQSQPTKQCLKIDIIRKIVQTNRTNK